MKRETKREIGEGGNAVKNCVVIALGGSLIVPELSNEGGVNVPFLRRFRSFLLREIKAGKRFVIVAGGGKTARMYQKSASRIVRVPAEDLDWIGIHSTRLNAHLLRTIFRDHAHPVVVDHDLSAGEARNLLASACPLFIASGWTPGWSTDYIAVRLAQAFSATEVIIAGDTPFVYDQDPKKNGNARPIKELSWGEYVRMIPREWTPGMSLPVDPVATRLALALGIPARIVEGHDLKNLKRAVEEKPFIGTLIS